MNVQSETKHSNDNVIYATPQHKFYSHTKHHHTHQHHTHQHHSQHQYHSHQHHPHQYHSQHQHHPHQYHSQHQYHSHQHQQHPDHYRDPNPSEKSRESSARILLRPEWRLHLAHLGSIYYQSQKVGKLYLLIDDRSPHLGSEILEYFIEDLRWLEVPNIVIVRISDYNELLFHCAYWFVDQGETHIEKVITGNRLGHPSASYALVGRQYGQDSNHDENSDALDEDDNKEIELDEHSEQATGFGGEDANGSDNGDEGDYNTDADDNADADADADGDEQELRRTGRTLSPSMGTKKYYLRESEIYKVKSYFNPNNLASNASRENSTDVPGSIGNTGNNVRRPNTPSAINQDVDSLHKISGHSKLRIRTNATAQCPSTVLMNYYLAEAVCDFNLSFCLPVIDSFLGVTKIFEQGNGSNHATISEDTHAFNRRIFTLLGKEYPTYERHPSYKLQNYRYHSETLVKLIETGILEGFDDPRLLTVRNIRQRGFPSGILREFATIGILRGTIDPQQLPDISKTFYLDKVLPKYNGIIEPVRIVLNNFDSNTTRYYSTHFCKEILALRKLFWIDRAEVDELVRPSMIFMLKGTNTFVQLVKRIAINEAGRNRWKQDHTNTYWEGRIVNRTEGLPFPQNLPWLSCDPIERPFKVRFHFYPAFYTGHNLPKCVKVLDGLLNQRPEKAGVVVIHGYGFFHYDGEQDLHLMYAFPKSRYLAGLGKP